MNKIGSIAAVGSLIVLFVGVIVALSLYSGGITSNIGSVTQTRTVSTNTTITFPANGVFLALNGQAISNLVVTNASGGAVVPATNYTITNYDVSTGTLAGGIKGKSGFYNGQSVNVTYVYEPVGYATDSGSRAMVGLIAVFAALGVVAFVVWKVYEDGMDWFK